MKNRLSLAFLFIFLISSGVTNAATQGVFDVFSKVSYKTVFKGVTDSDVKASLQESSKLVRLEKTAPISWMALRQRARDDEEQILKVLRAFGYYDATVKTTVHQKQNQVEVEVTQGPAYSLTDYSVSFIEQQEQPQRPSNRRLGIKLKQTAVAQTIIDADEKLIDELSYVGFPFAQILHRQDQIDYKNKVVKTIVYVDQGAKAKFGPIEWKGINKIKVSYPKNRITWERGDLFDRSKIDKVRRALVESRVYKGVTISFPSQVDKNGELPITITLQEAKFKTIEVGLGYNVDDNFKGKLAWEHRNVSGRADSFEVDITRSKQELGGGIQYRLPDVFSKQNTFIVSAEVEEEKPDAYDSLRGGVLVSLERSFGNGYQVSGGLSLEAGRSDRDGVRTYYQTYGVPLSFSVKRVANPLDPTFGFKTSIEVHPQAGHISDKDYFVVTKLNQSFYLPLDKPRKMVMAVWGKVNFLMSGSRASIPNSKLLYAGGAGSVRGYRHQRLGPVDINGTAIGGRSSVQGGIEARLRVHEKVSIVPFYEGGNVREESTPNFKKDFLWGYGIGARYHLDFAPIRVDFAFPQKVRRINGKKVDSKVNFYFSIGQAF